MFHFNYLNLSICMRSFFRFMIHEMDITLGQNHSLQVARFKIKVRSWSVTIKFVLNIASVHVSRKNRIGILFLYFNLKIVSKMKDKDLTKTSSN